jgi:hypothetical protein
MSFEEIPHCDIFKPSWDEFVNFAEYVEKIQKIAKSGIVKVKINFNVKIIPPKGYKARKDEYKGIDFVVPHPIEQIVSGKEGLFELILLQRESRSLAKYAKLVEGYDKDNEKKEPLEIEKKVSQIFPNLFFFNKIFLFFFTQ